MAANTGAPDSGDNDEMPDRPELSVLIATLDYPDIHQVVASLLQQDLPASSYEVIVADSREGAWKDIVAREAVRNPAVAVTYLQQDCDLHHRARVLNAAIQASRGRILVFLAGDFTPESNFTGAHLQFHQQHPEMEAVAVGPGKFVREQTQGPLVQWLEESGRLFGVRLGQDDAGGFFYVGNSSAKREFINRVGLFDEDILFDAMDDFELGHRLRRAGMRSYHLPEAVTRHQHEHEVKLADYANSMRMLGRSAVIFEDKYPGPQEWDAICRRTPFSLRMDAVWWRMRYALTWRPESLHRYYISMRDAFFVEGWRRGRQRRPQTPA